MTDDLQPEVEEDPTADEYDQPVDNGEAERIDDDEEGDDDNG